MAGRRRRCLQPRPQHRLVRLNIHVVLACTCRWSQRLAAVRDRCLSHGKRAGVDCWLAFAQVRGGLGRPRGAHCQGARALGAAAAGAAAPRPAAAGGRVPPQCHRHAVAATGAVPPACHQHIYSISVMLLPPVSGHRSHPWGTTCLIATMQDCRQEDRRWMSRLGRVMFLVERTRRTRPNDVAAVTDATADQVCKPPAVRACRLVAIRRGGSMLSYGYHHAACSTGDGACAGEGAAPIRGPVVRAAAAPPRHRSNPAAAQAPEGGWNIALTCPVSSSVCIARLYMECGDMSASAAGKHTVSTWLRWCRGRLGGLCCSARVALGR